MEYTIVQSPDIGRLSQYVNQKIQEGWVPAGGVAVSTQASQPNIRTGEWAKVGPPVPLYLQAMTLSVK